MTIKTDTAATSPPASTPDLCNQDRQTITVWSDISCPWATLALHTLHAAAAKRGVELLIDHRAFPLELFNREPTPKPIIDAEIVAIAGLRPELGWRPWPGPESTYPVTMLARSMPSKQQRTPPSEDCMPATSSIPLYATRSSSKDAASA